MDEARRVRAIAEKNPKLREQIESRFAKHRFTAGKQARAMAEKDDEGISTVEKFEAYLWSMWADDAIKTARDVLGKDFRRG